MTLRKKRIDGRVSHHESCDRVPCPWCVAALLQRRAIVGAMERHPARFGHELLFRDVVKSLGQNLCPERHRGRVPTAAHGSAAMHHPNERFRGALVVLLPRGTQWSPPCDPENLLDSPPRPLRREACRPTTVALILSSSLHTHGDGGTWFGYNDVVVEGGRGPHIYTWTSGLGRRRQ